MPRTPPAALPSRLMPLALLALACGAPLAATPATAADLDQLYDPLGGAPPPAAVPVVPVTPGRGRVVVVPAQNADVLGDPALVVGRPVGTVRLPPPPPVGGAFLYVPGLNGPLGPPAYPLLPFAFGYGY